MAACDLGLLPLRSGFDHDRTNTSCRSHSAPGAAGNLRREWFLIADRRPRRSRVGPRCQWRSSTMAAVTAAATTSETTAVRPRRTAHRLPATRCRIR